MDLDRLRTFFSATPRSCAPSGCGIITAADANLFGGLQMLLLSIDGRAPVAIVDLGLTAAQADWCRAMPQTQILPCPPLAVPRSLEMWQSWNKPLYLSMTPFENSIWLDADTFVLASLQPLFDEIARGFWVVKHRARYFPNTDPRLYQRRPVAHRLPPTLRLNAGVIGYRRGDPLIECWATAATGFAHDPELRSWLAYHDEGALHWTIESIGCHRRILDRPQWNWVVWDLARTHPTLEEFVRDFERGDKVIVHATGKAKVWRRRNGPILPT